MSKKVKTKPAPARRPAKPKLARAKPTSSPAPTGSAKRATVVEVAVVPPPARSQGAPRPEALACMRYELEVAIDAPRERVWSALTEETDGWWLADFRMIGVGSSVTLDARAGGALIERRPGGGSLLWYQVLLCNPGVTLHLAGHISPAFGGPATTMLTIELEETPGGGTLLRASDALYGRVDDEVVTSLRNGWKQLFGEGLKPHAEALR